MEDNIQMAISAIILRSIEDGSERLNSVVFSNQVFDKLTEFDKKIQ